MTITRTEIKFTNQPPERLTCYYFMGQAGQIGALAERL